MSERPYELVQTPAGAVARVRVRGRSVLASPLLNRGTAFTPEEREALGLTGLLPSGVSTMEAQLRRTYAQFGRQADDLGKNVYLANLRDRNEVLFYRLLSEHLEEMLPIVYTPTVGQAIERFSHEFRRPRGIYLSVDQPEKVEEALRNSGLGPEEVDLLVATDSEGILGIGDQGVGGIEIAIGKLAVYIAAAGIHPLRVIPVVLDMGTDNLALLSDDMYLGNRHARVRDHRYDELIDAYVTAATKLFPNALLHWEDFGASNARRILNKYADQVCTFNDDMQGTAAVVLAAAFSAVRAAGHLRPVGVVPGGRAGPEYHEPPMPEAPDPETVPVWQERLKEYGPRVPARWLRPRPVEVRYVGDPPWAAQADGGPRAPRTMVWLRAQIFQDGRLIASVVQEGLIRVSP